MEKKESGVVSPDKPKFQPDLLRFVTIPGVYHSLANYGFKSYYPGERRLEFFKIPLYREFINDAS